MRNYRAEFPRHIREEAWKRSKGICEGCGAPLAGRRPEYDHQIPSALGGGNDLTNCVVLCPPCHRVKTVSKDIPRIAKAKRVEARRAGLKPKSHWSKQYHRAKQWREMEKDG